MARRAFTVVGGLTLAAAGAVIASFVLHPEQRLQLGVTNNNFSYVAMLTNKNFQSSWHKPPGPLTIAPIWRCRQAEAPHDK